MSRIAAALLAFFSLYFATSLAWHFYLLAAIMIGSCLQIVRCSRMLASFQFPRKAQKYLTLAAVFFVSLAYAQWRAEIALGSRLDPACHGEKVLISGFITSTIETAVVDGFSSYRHAKNRRDRFTLAVSTIEPLSTEGLCGRTKLIERLDVSYYSNSDLIVGETELSQPVLKTGDLISASIKLQAIRGLSAPNSFDSEAHALLKRTDARATVMEVLSVNADYRAQESAFWRSWKSFKRAAQDSIAKAAGNYEMGAVINALALADRQYISENQKRRYSYTGTSHLIAVSGLHVGLCLASAFLLLNMASSGSISPSIKQIVCSILAVCMGLLYLALASWPVTGQRALIMISLLTLFTLSGKHTSRFTAVLLTVAALCIYDPLLVLDGALWLSVGAVLVILHTSASMDSSVGQKVSGYKYQVRRLLNGIKALVLLQLAFAVSMPFIQSSMGMPFYLGSFIANLVAIPVYSLLVIPCVLGALCLLTFATAINVSDSLIVVIASRLLSVSDTTISLVNHYLDWCLSLGVSGAPIIISTSLLVPGLVFSLLLLRGRYLPAFLATVLIWLGLVYSGVSGQSSIRLEPGDLLVTQIDVGQGSAYLLQSSDASWLYDTGPSYRFGGNAASATIVPTLRYYGIKYLDVLMISHGDQDHAGGMHTILDNFLVGTLYFGSLPSKLSRQDVIISLANSNRRLSEIGLANFVDFDAGEKFPVADGAVLSCEAGQIMPELGELDANILWPPAGSSWRAPGVLATNDQSCVLAIYADDNRGLILLPGDIGGAIEKSLVESYRDSLRFDLVAVSHHGSNSSSTHTFLDALNAKNAVISAGHANRYGHPHVAVQKRLKQRNIGVIDSASAGTVQWLYRAKSGKWEGPFCSRFKARGFWSVPVDTGQCVSALK